MKTRQALLMAAGILLLSQVVSAADSLVFQIIVNASNPVDSLKRSQVSKLFLKKTTAWENGLGVMPIDLSEGSTLREAFSRDIHAKSSAVIKAYWQQKVFSGGDVPPVEVASDEQVLDYVKAHKGAIGYVAIDTPVSEVKVLKLID